MALLKHMGMALLGLAFFVGLIIFALLYIWGIAWVSVRIFEYVVIANSVAFLVALLLLPLALFRATRLISAIGLLITSYVFGLTVWIYGFLVTYIAWGLIGVFIGLVFGFVGVVPLGMIAAGMHSEWDVVAQLVIGVALTYGARAIAMGLAAKIDRDEMVRNYAMIESGS